MLFEQISRKIDFAVPNRKEKIERDKKLIESELIRIALQAKSATDAVQEEEHA
jgi:hypothetical protein